MGTSLNLLKSTPLDHSGTKATSFAQFFWYLKVIIYDVKQKAVMRLCV